MRFSSVRLLGLTIVTLGSLVQTPGMSHAVSFTVTLDTTSLATQPTPPKPFALDFQFIDGDSTVSNTVTLSHFDFGAGGGPNGSPTISGGASGDLSGTVTLTDSSFFNELFQGFTPSGSDPLRFLLTLTTNVEPVTPDTFTLAIFDSSGTEIPTSSLGAFARIDITNPLTINTYASDTRLAPPGCPTCPAIALGAPVVELAGTPVPEPGTVLLLVSGVAVALLAQRRRRG
jgi:hypothetical protein